MRFSGILILMIALITTASVFVFPSVKNKIDYDDGYKKVESYSERY